MHAPSPLVATIELAGATPVTEVDMRVRIDRFTSVRAIPTHYISRIVVNAGGKALLAAETGISLSENPTLRIVSEVPLPLLVMVDEADSETHAHYTATWKGDNGLLRRKRRMRRIGTAASWPNHSVSNEDFARNFCQPRRARSTLAFG